MLGVLAKTSSRANKALHPGAFRLKLVMADMVDEVHDAVVAKPAHCGRYGVLAMLA